MYTSIICAFTCKRSSKCTRGNSSSRRLFYTFNLTSSRSASRLKCANSCLTLPSSLLQLWCAWLIYIHCTHKHWGQKLARMCIFFVKQIFFQKQMNSKLFFIFVVANILYCEDYFQSEEFLQPRRILIRQEKSNKILCFVTECLHLQIAKL